MTSKADFPFYNGQPVTIHPLGWLAILAATMLGFVVLVAPIPALSAFPLNFMQTVLFVGIPLAALAWAAGPSWRGALFRRYGVKQFGISLGFAVLTIGSSALVALVLSQFMSFAANPTGAVIADGGGWAFVAFLARTGIQLIGEEVVTILPFLAVLWLCFDRFKLPKVTSIVLALLVSTLWFSAMHLQTYDWNYVQCFAIIGSARIMLTLAYIVTRNIWVSIGAHIINDWSIFAITFVGSHVPIAVGG